MYFNRRAKKIHSEGGKIKYTYRINLCSGSTRRLISNLALWYGVYLSVSNTPVIAEDIAACTWWCVFNVSGIIMGIGVVRDCGMHLWWFAVTVFIFQPRSFCWHWLGMQGQAECRCLLQVTLLCPYMEIYHLFLIGWMWDWCVPLYTKCFALPLASLWYYISLLQHPLDLHPLRYFCFVSNDLNYSNDFTLFYMCYVCNLSSFIFQTSSWSP